MSAGTVVGFVVGAAAGAGATYYGCRRFGKGAALSPRAPSNAS